MGATDSKSQQDTAQLQDGANSAPVEESGSQTPLSDRRLVKLRDPRSPTDDVQRTPIIVPKPEPAAADDDSFEDPRSPTVRIARTPIPDSDPRSPTVGVSRTPCPFTYPDPRSPTTNVARTPMLKESESGRFDLPPISKNDKIEEEEEEAQEEESAKPEVDKVGEDEEVEEEEEEAQNTSNNNSGDTVRLIDPLDAPGLPSERLDAAGNAEPNGPAAEESTNETEDEDGQSQKLISSSKGTSKKSRKPSLTKSLRAKMHRSNPAPPRSPLSTRNLEKDSPAVHLRPAEGVIAFGKEGSRRRQISGTPTRLVGRYEIMVDKENF